MVNIIAGNIVIFASTIDGFVDDIVGNNLFNFRKLQRGAVNKFNRTTLIVATAVSNGCIPRHGRKVQNVNIAVVAILATINDFIAAFFDLDSIAAFTAIDAIITHAATDVIVALVTKNAIVAIQRTGN